MAKLSKLMSTTLFVGILVVLASLVTYALYLKDFAQTPGTNAIKVEVTIHKGASARQISRALCDAGLVNSSNEFYWYLRLIARKANTLKAGEYVVDGKMTPDQIIALLQKGLRKEIRFSIPEGTSQVQIAQIIGASNLVLSGEMLNAMRNLSLVHELGIPSVEGGLEGYLFPDTYQFPKGTSGETILRRMHARLIEKITPDMLARMKALNWTLHDMLTLASIVEKETGAATERPLIASVFLNRLSKGMLLQTDPTVIYAIRNFDGNIKKKDLLHKHPYNTYVHAGLPPGPISSPGIESIKAVLWPAHTKYYYFVSRNDGTHVFCENYNCHLRAVKKWQLR